MAAPEPARTPPTGLCFNPRPCTGESCQHAATNPLPRVSIPTAASFGSFRNKSLLYRHLRLPRTSSLEGEPCSLPVRGRPRAGAGSDGFRGPWLPTRGRGSFRGGMLPLSLPTCDNASPHRDEVWRLHGDMPACRHTTSRQCGNTARESDEMERDRRNASSQSHKVRRSVHKAWRLSDEAKRHHDNTPPDRHKEARLRCKAGSLRHQV